MRKGDHARLRCNGAHSEYYCVPLASLGLCESAFIGLVLRRAPARALLEADATALSVSPTMNSSIGLAEALPHVVPAYLAQRRARAALLLRPPDAACLIDYPGVNVPFGEWLHKAVSSCRQCYYVPPNEWLLTDRRTPQIVRNTHKLLAVRLCHATGRRARVMYGRALALH